MTGFDKQLLFKPRIPRDVPVDVPGLGEMRIRVLSRAEVVDELNTVDRSVPGAWEARLVAMSLVDPELTEEEVLEWRALSEPAEIGALIDKIHEVSGLTKASAKDAYKEFESNPDAEFRVLPGGEAGDDGRPAP